MDAELKTKWVEALRSGEYDQGKNALKSTDGSFCCLGVLCDLKYGKEIWKENKDCYGDYSGTYRLSPINGKGVDFPTENKRRELGISNSVMRQLAEMNDDDYSFEQIADVIETLDVSKAYKHTDV
jgi:hypothetical protein